MRPAAFLLLAACGGGFDPSGSYTLRVEIEGTDPAILVPCDGGEATGTMVLRKIEHREPHTHAGTYTFCGWPEAGDFYATFPDDSTPWFGEWLAGQFNLSEGTATKDQLTARARGMGWHHLRLVLDRQ